MDSGKRDSEHWVGIGVGCIVKRMELLGNTFLVELLKQQVIHQRYSCFTTGACTIITGCSSTILPRQRLTTLAPTTSFHYQRLSQPRRNTTGHGNTMVTQSISRSRSDVLPINAAEPDQNTYLLSKTNSRPSPRCLRKKQWRRPCMDTDICSFLYSITLMAPPR